MILVTKLTQLGWVPLDLPTLLFFSLIDLEEPNELWSGRGSCWCDWCVWLSSGLRAMRRPPIELLHNVEDTSSLHVLNAFGKTIQHVHSRLVRVLMDRTVSTVFLSINSHRCPVESVAARHWQKAVGLGGAVLGQEKKRNFLSPIRRRHVGENLWRLGCEPHYTKSTANIVSSQNEYPTDVHASVVDAVIRCSFALLKFLRFFVLCGSVVEVLWSCVSWLQCCSVLYVSSV